MLHRKNAGGEDMGGYRKAFQYYYSKAKLLIEKKHTEKKEPCSKKKSATSNAKSMHFPSKAMHCCVSGHLKRPVVSIQVEVSFQEQTCKKFCKNVCVRAHTHAHACARASQGWVL